LERYQTRNYEYIGYNEFKDIVRTLSTVHDQIAYCSSTVEHLININRKKAGLDKQWCDAHQVIREVMQLHHAPFQLKKIHCHCRFNKHLPPIAIGTIEFNQVISSILDNAEQAMPSGGTCRITTAFLKTLGLAQIMIRDDGIGIPAENLPYIFEPFYTTKQRGVDKNSGLGLSIVSSLIKSCQGNIQVLSPLTKGTTVIIRLPVVKKTSAFFKKF
jgi:signal transduction histidine kinase